MLEIPEPKALIFDWDNTLVDSWNIIHDAMNYTLVQNGMAPWSLNETKMRVNKSMRDSFPTLFGDSWENAAHIFYKRYKEIHLTLLKPLPHSEELLKMLHTNNLFISIVSNKLGKYLRLESEYLGWNKYLTNLIGANDAKFDKPAKDPVYMALKNSGQSPNEKVWFIGDSHIDLKCAINSGCTPILINPNDLQSNEFKEYPPSMHFKDCYELQAFIKTLFK